MLGARSGIVGLAGAQDEGLYSVVEEPVRKHIAAVIPCKKMIDRGLYESIKRRTNEAMAQKAAYLIYEIDTFGGDLYAADSISSYFLHEANPQVHTVAYVSKKAISAGAMISVACEDVIMKEKTTIGDCAPIILGGKLEGVEREKIESFTRAAFVNAAQANGYPEALLKSMVSRQLEIYRVKNLETGEYAFFETKDLPKDEATYDIENKELVVKNDELLTLTASDATRYGVARAEVKDLQGVLDFLAERDGVTFPTEPLVFKTNWSEEMVRWINSPAIMAVLVMLTMLGVYVEFNTPGLGLPGLMALICVVIIVGSKFLVGMANWVEVAVFVVGIVLLVIEIFAIPGFGIAGLTGILCIMLGGFGMLVKNPPDRLPWPKQEFGGWESVVDGLVGISLGFAAFLVLAWLFAKYLPKMQFLSGLVLAPFTKGGQMPISMTSTGQTTDVQVRVGDVGQVVSPLRPAGQVKFDSAVVDVVSRAEFIENGVTVSIIEIHGNRVIVQPIEN
jgi:membrane-bound serine protease (ClpP class)